MKIFRTIGPYTEYCIPDTLCRKLDALWLITPVGRGSQPIPHRVLPFVECGITISLHQTKNGCFAPEKAVFFGPKLKAADFIYSTDQWCVGVTFKCEWVQNILNVNPFSIKDGALPLHWLSQKLRDSLFTALCHARTIESVLSAFSLSIFDYAESAKSNYEDRNFIIAMAALRAGLNENSLSVSKISDQVGVSPRSIQRLFSTHAGLPAQTIARLLRFDYAIRVADRAPELSGAQLAAIAGYADQAHMIRDFQRNTELTPARLSALRQTESQLFNSVSY